MNVILIFVMCVSGCFDLLYCCGLNIEGLDKFLHLANKILVEISRAVQHSLHSHKIPTIQQGKPCIVINSEATLRQVNH